MSALTRKARNADLAFCVGVLALSLIVLAQAWRLPPSRFDPLGPGSFPIGICLLLAVLSGAGLALSFFGRSLGEAETSMILGVGGSETGGRRRPWLSVSIFLLTSAYAAALAWAPVGFFVATALFVSAAGIAMSRRTPRALATAVAVGIGMSAALSLLFGRLLTIVLP